MNVQQDLRFSLRMMIKSPGFTVVAVGILALGIGACAAIFSIVNALLIQPLPYADPERVVLTLGWDLREDDMVFNVSSADFAVWRDDVADVFESSGAYRFWSVNLTGAGDPWRLQGYQVTPDMFDLLGRAPILGRVFEHDAAGAADDRELMLSHRTWLGRFDGDPGVIGRVVNVNDEPHTIVGVMPERFEFPQGNFRGDVWRPLRVDAGGLADRQSSVSLVGIGRLRSDVSLDQAQARFDTVYSNLEADFPDSNTNLGVRLRSMGEFLAGPMRPGLLALLGAVGFLLLVACANVANLLLVRARSREREIAIRAALGAGRWRLMRQLCLEHLLLSLLAGLAGIVVAGWMLDAMLGQVPEFYARAMPAIMHIAIDGNVLLFAIGVATITGVGFGLLPALVGTRPDLTRALKDGGGQAGTSRRRLSGALVATELALSVLLLVGAGLLSRSYGNLRGVDLGFDTDHVWTGRVALPAASYGASADQVAFYDALLFELNRTPGVESVGLVNTMPMSTSNSNRQVSVEGETIDPEQGRRRADYRNISPAYFETMGIRLVAGRTFDDRDRGADAALATVVNERFVERYVTDREPIGTRIKIGAVGPNDPWWEIVGVVGNVKHFAINTPAEPEMYVSYAQVPRSSMTIVARATGDPMALSVPIRRATGDVDATLPIYDVQPLAAAVSNMLFGASMITMLMSTFAFLALLLASVGLYGLIAHAVAQRRAEIGVRMALGATRRDIIRLVFGSGMVTLTFGLLAGLGLAVLASRALASLLYDLNPLDPMTFVGVAMAVSVVAMLAHIVPAWSAAKLDPANALRCE